MKPKRESRGRDMVVFYALWLAFLAAGDARALEWQSAGPHRSAAVTVPAGGRAGFSLMPGAVTGISFTNVLPQSRHLTNQVLLNGSGVTAGDVDGDGWCDVYFCGLDRPNALYRNLGGWKFVDITTEAGVACAGLTSSGCALVDFDGDGDLDLVVSTIGHGTRVFANDGKGRFTEVAVLNGVKGGMSLLLGRCDLAFLTPFFECIFLPPQYFRLFLSLLCSISRLILKSDLYILNNTLIKKMPKHLRITLSQSFKTMRFDIRVARFYDEYLLRRP